MTGRRMTIALVALTVLVAAASGMAIRSATSKTETKQAAADPPAGKQYKESIFNPPNAGQTRTGDVDPMGRPVTVPCASCHASLTPPTSPPAIDDIETVHDGLAFTHGDLTCFACHDPDSKYNSLRLADGTNVTYSDVMTLCSQCHGPQRNDYDHGAHGGMSGYWDLSRGPRDRNGCTVCHDPHSPAFPKMRPTFKPIDRFLNAPTETESSDEH